MSMYAVKNDNGEWLDWEVYLEYPEFIRGSGSMWTDLDSAKFYAKSNGGYVVELIEAPAKVVVSEDEAEMLERAKYPTNYGFRILYDYANQHGGYLLGNKEFESRLMRAYVNGWTVEEPKRWNVKVPHTTDELYWKRGNGNIGCAGAWQNDGEIVRNRAFTLAEIEHYGLQDCEKVEVTNYDN